MMHNRLRLAAATLTATIATGAGAAETPVAVDVNPAPDVFETTLTASISSVDLDGNGMMVECWTFEGSRPGPEIRVNVGDLVIVHLVNDLPAPTSLHWHGIEVPNAADGTSVTQRPVMPGESFTYRFVVPRAGQFYYHPHMKPMNQVWKGMYGSVIVTEPAEATLRDLGVLPSREHTLVMSDVTVAQPVGSNNPFNFPPDPLLPWAGGDSFPGNAFSPTPIDLIENLPRDNDGFPTGGPPVPAGTIPNIAPVRDCRDVPEIPCRTNEGLLVLANGRTPLSRAGSPEAPGVITPAADVLTVPAGRGLRLRMMNAAVQRYFRLRATDGNGTLLPLYRIGGEGGLLDAARLEGGIQGSYDTKYELGEIVLGTSQRADVVLIADTTPGDVITLWTLDYERAGFGWTRVPTVPVMHILVTEGDGGVDSITDGTPLRTNPKVNDPVESLADLPVDAFVDPAALSPPQAGSDDETIRLTNILPDGVRYPSVDQVRGAFEGGGPTAPPPISTSRWARVDDVLELVARNETNAHHPWHHHGFSFQPLRLETLDGTPVMTYPTEFVDVVDIPGQMQVVYRMRLEDRAQGDGVTGGGAIGRWLFHCHLFHHAVVGMISELIVLPPCTGDVNADEMVDFNDLLILLTDWGSDRAAADTDVNGVVDAFDLQRLLASWGPCAG